MTRNPPFVALTNALPALSGWLAIEDGLPPKDDSTSHPHSVRCLIIHHGDQVSQGFLYLPADPDNPGLGFDEVSKDQVYVDAWMPMPKYSEEVRTRYLLDKAIGKKVVKALMAEAAKRQREPAPAPAPFFMTEADCIAADLHNDRDKAGKAHAAQTRSAMALELKHAQHEIAA